MRYFNWLIDVRNETVRTLHVMRVGLAKIGQTFALISFGGKQQQKAGDDGNADTDLAG